MQRLPKQMKRTVLGACIALVVLGIGCVVFLYAERATRSRREVLSMYNHLHGGMTMQDIYRVYREGSYRYLRLRNIDNATLLVQTPVEFAAANWVLWIELSSNKVSGIRIRYHDSRNVKPKRAPEDKPLLLAPR